MSTQTAEYPGAPATAEPPASASSGRSPADATTEEMPLEQVPLRPSLVNAWITALRAAESLHLCLHPTYLRRPEAELVAYVTAALRGQRDASRLVAEVLARGTRP